MKQVWWLFAGFSLLFILNLGITMPVDPTPRMWLLLSSSVGILSIYLLAKNGLPPKTQVIVSLVLGLLMFVAYRGVSFSSIQTFVVTTLGSLALFSVFRRYEAQSLPLLRSETWRSIAASILLGLLVGGVLGVVNLFIASETPELNLRLVAFLTALSPAIYEEMALRAFFYGLCLHFFQGAIRTKGQRFTTYFMMVLPHAMIHTPDQFITLDLVSGVIGIIMLSLVFGLPFALLQRKRDLTSAMVAHGVVVVIRFSFLGLPF